MYELYPYFTNDGTVGLFSCVENDIYHSTYGALSESWSKFIIPSHFEDYLATHDEVKLLDICYGIGYNTKTALNVFVKNYFKHKKNNIELNSKQHRLTPPSIAAIDTNNAGAGEVEKFYNKDVGFFKKILQNILLRFKSASSCIVAIGVDNVQDARAEEICKNCNKILIDAVDSDNILIDISPFIIKEQKFNFGFALKKNYNNYLSTTNIKYQQINTIRKPTKKINKKFKLKEETLIIILQKLFEQNSEFFDDPNLQQILTAKKYSPFFSKYMLNFARFYQNRRYYLSKNQNKSTFLHNIYYRYLSKSYKNATDLLLNTQIELNLHKNDARTFIKTNLSKYNFIFLDAFTPAKSPTLWTVQFFKELHAALEDDGMILTYSNSAAIRNAFLQNGFYVGKIYDENLKKFTGTVAVKNEYLIEHKLSDYDLDLIGSKAGICFQDENLESDSHTIIKNREKETESSNLVSSSKIVKGYKKNHAKEL